MLKRKVTLKNDHNKEENNNLYFQPKFLIMLQKPSPSRIHFRIPEPSHAGTPSTRLSPAVAYSLLLYNSVLVTEISE